MMRTWSWPANDIEPGQTVQILPACMAIQFKLDNIFPLISPELVKDDSINGRRMSPFKKFSRVRIKVVYYRHKKIRKIGKRKVACLPITVKWTLLSLRYLATSAARVGFDDLSSMINNTCFCTPGRPCCLNMSYALRRAAAVFTVKWMLGLSPLSITRHTSSVV